MGGDAVEVFESLGQYEDGIVAAKADFERLPFHFGLRIQSQAGLGRCHAQLGRATEAETAFKWAIAEARRCHMCLLELFAYVDYIKHVLDPAGRRDEALPGLGACILQMASRPDEFNALLGDGLDAEAAVAVAAPRG